MNTLQEIEKKHISVLLHELVEYTHIFSDKKNTVIDATLGMGGHASKIIEKLHTGDIFIGFDADIKNLETAQKRLIPELEKREITYFFIHSNFSELKQELLDRDITNITAIYYDLGLSSLHLDEAERGFSFMQDGPLDMRLDKSQGRTAAQIINSYTAAELREIFLKYGEEAGANKIAHRIVSERKKEKYKTTSQLSETIGGGPKTKAKIFQAIRIEVNKELEAIETSIYDAISLLESGGSIFVISFHSLEDRIVKHIFKKETKDCICREIICNCHHTKSLKVLTKKPILPTDEEIEYNKRSRSAKARAAIKI